MNMVIIYAAKLIATEPYAPMLSTRILTYLSMPTHNKHHKTIVLNTKSINFVNVFLPYSIHLFFFVINLLNRKMTKENWMTDH